MPRCSSDTLKQHLAKHRQSKDPSMPCRGGLPGWWDGQGQTLQQSWEWVSSCITKEPCGCSIKLLVTLGERRALPLTMGHS